LLQDLGQDMLEFLFEGCISLLESILEDCAGIFIPVWGSG